MTKYVRGPGGSAINAEHFVRLFVLQGGARTCAGLREPDDDGYYVVAESLSGDISDLAVFNDRMNAEDAIEELVAAIANPNSQSLLGLFPLDRRLAHANRNDIRLEHQIASRNDAGSAAVAEAATVIARAVHPAEVPIGV